MLCCATASAEGGARETALLTRSLRSPAQVLPALREVDLYSFQGLYKAEGKKRFGPQYEDWKNDPSNFEIDGHAPVRRAYVILSRPFSEA